MPVIRIEKTANYTVISNYPLRDSRLSLKACALLCKMLCNTDTWDYSITGMAAMCKDGKSAVSSAMKELEQYGYPARIESAETTIAGLKKDRVTTESHPHPTDGFAGMEIKGKHYSEKDTAGEALLVVMKDVQGLEPLKISSYRGFDLSLTLEDFGRQYVMTLKGEISHKVDLGNDVRGNLIRIDNVLGNIPGRIQAAEVQLASIREQLETAKAEVGKPFPQEEELKTKNARLIELNAELDIEKQRTPEQTAEKKDDIVAKSAKPSILQKLRSAPPQTGRPAETKKIHRNEEVL